MSDENAAENLEHLHRLFQHTPLASAVTVRPVTLAYRLPTLTGALLSDWCPRLENEERQGLHALAVAVPGTEEHRRLSQLLGKVFKTAQDSTLALEFKPLATHKITETDLNGSLSYPANVLLNNFERAGFNGHVRASTSTMSTEPVYLQNSSAALSLATLSRELKIEVSTLPSGQMTVNKGSNPVDVKPGTKEVTNSSQAPLLISPSKRKGQEIVHDSPSSKRNKVMLGTSSSANQGLEALPSKLIVASEKFVMDHRSEANSVREQIVSFMADLFEAEDELEAGVSSQHSSNGTQHWFRCFDNGREPSLNLATTQRTFSMIRKCCQVGVLSLLPVSNLLRVQRILCKAFADLSFEKVFLSLDTEEDEKWTKAFEVIEIALLSTSCILMMLTVEVDKQLHSEEMLLALIDPVKSALEDILYKWLVSTDQNKLQGLGAKPRTIEPMLHYTIQVLQLLSTICGRITFTDMVVSRVEMMVIPLLFLESPAKDFAICQRLTLASLKISAVTLTQTLFMRFPSQRIYLIEEIITNLNTLPTGKSNLRLYRLPDGKSIHLISALFLHLVQSCAVISERVPDTSEAIIEPTASKAWINGAFGRYAHQLQAANNTANFIIQRLVDKAYQGNKDLKDSKGSASNSTIRIFLDVLLDDFITVLGIPEWPSAEALLRAICTKILAIVDDQAKTSSTPMKVQALSDLCLIGTKIRSIALTLNNQDGTLSDETSIFLRQIPLYTLNGKPSPKQLNDLCDLQSIVLTHVRETALQDPTFIGASEYCFARWITLLARSSSDQEKDESTFIYNIAAKFLGQPGEKASSFLSIPVMYRPMSAGHLEHASHILNSYFGLLQMFDSLLQRIISLLDSTQVTLRVKALRSFGNIASVDPALLSHSYMKEQIDRRLSDSSPQVRDVAIEVLGRYLKANPEFGKEHYQLLSSRTTDTGTGVRKRVLTLLKELYLQLDEILVRSDIALKFLYGLQDEEDTVQNLVIKFFEEIWFNPLKNFEDCSEIQLLPAPQRQDIYKRVEIMSHVASESPDESAALLEALLRRAYDQSKTASQLATIYALIAQQLIDMILATEDYHEDVRIKALCAAKVMAEACPRSFSTNQMTALRPYIEQGTASSEQNASISICSIYIAVLPKLTSQNKQFLADVQRTLLTQLTKVSVRVLDKLVPCLCIVASLLKDFSRLASTVKNCMNGLQEGGKPEKVQILFITLLGLFGRYCAFSQMKTIQAVFGVEHSEKLIDRMLPILGSFCSFTTPIGPLSRAALRAMGNISISYSSRFISEPFLTIVDTVMCGDSRQLKKVILNLFRDFLREEERKAENILRSRAVDKKTKSPHDKIEVDVGTLTGNTEKFQDDGVSTSLMQRHLSGIMQSARDLDISLSTIAMEVLASIVSQGLANPRSCIPTIIALETSPTNVVRQLAIRAHMKLKEKHESLIETAYIDGIRECFKYQMTLTNDTVLFSNFATLEPMYSIVRGQDNKSRLAKKKFLQTLVKSLNFDPENIGCLSEDNVHYAWFVGQSISTFNYSAIEEVLVVIYELDRILSTTGSSILQIVDCSTNLSSHSVLGQQCRASAMLSTCVVVRKYLQSLYNLTDAKLASFSISKSSSAKDTKPAERRTGVHECPDLSTVDGRDQANVQVNHLTSRIQVFKQLFGEDDTSSASYALSSKAADSILDDDYEEGEEDEGPLEAGQLQQLFDTPKKQGVYSVINTPPLGRSPHEKASLDIAHFRRDPYHLQTNYM